jgi:hypothetical protein
MTSISRISSSSKPCQVPVGSDLVDNARDGPGDALRERRVRGRESAKAEGNVVGQCHHQRLLDM